MNYWSSMHARLLDVIKLRNSIRKKGLGHVRRECIQYHLRRASEAVHTYWLDEVAEKVEPEEEPFVDELGEPTINMTMENRFKVSLQNITEDTGGLELNRLQRIAFDQVSRARTKDSTNRKREMQKWIMDQLKRGAGALHKAVSGNTKPPPRLIVGDVEKADPLIVAQDTLDEWQKHWKIGKYNNDYEQALRELTRAAKEEDPLEPFSDARVHQLCIRGPANAKGTDLATTRDLPRGGEEATMELAALLRGVEETLQWPAQELCNSIAMQPKADSMDDRPITLTGAGLYRTWSKLRKPYAVEYDTTKAGWWDAAIKGSSCLRVALLRELKMDIAKSYGLHVAAYFFDLAKFFDSISLAHLMRACLVRNFGAKLMLLALKVHRAARVLLVQTQAGMCCSLPVLPGHYSMIAGCGWSITFTRIHIYDLCEAMSTAHPASNLTTWVDDLFAMAIGKDIKNTAKEAVDLGSCFLKMARRYELDVSKKSNCITSSLQLRRLMMQRPSTHKKSWVISMVNGSKYLGIDMNLSKKRKVAAHGKRFAKAVSRSHRVQKLMKNHCKGARRLITTGVMPQALWGHQCMGMSPTMRIGLKRRLAVDSGARVNGGCTSTAVQLQLNIDQDPEVAVPLQLIASYLSFAPTLSKQTLLLKQFWSDKFAQLDTPHRWKIVSSQIEAVIATLLDAGWKPMCPWAWKTHTGQWLELDPSDPGMPEEVLRLLREALVDRIHQKCNEHYLGGGARQGFDLKLAKNALKRSTGDPSAYGRYSAIFQGAIWDEARKALCARPPENTECKFCRHPSCDWIHECYECPKTLTAECKDIQATNHLCANAAKHLRDIAINDKDKYQTFWLRGLPGKGMTAVPAPPTETKLHVGGCLAFPAFHEAMLETRQLSVSLEGFGSHSHSFLFQPKPANHSKRRFLLPKGAKAGSDGSGGSHSNDTRLRRCAWALVIVGNRMETLGWAFGPTPGLQSVPNSELFGLYQAADLTEGDLEITIDNEYVVNGFNRGPNWQHNSHQKLWSLLWQVIAGREGRIVVHWGPSHEFESSLSRGVQQQWQAHCNHLADALAEKAAGHYQLDSIHIDGVKYIDSQTRLIHKRLFAVHTFYSEIAKEDKEKQREANEAANPEPQVPAAPKPTRQETLVQLIKQSPHNLDLKQPSVYNCIRCLEKYSKYEEGLAEWLISPCVVKRPFWIHEQHDYKYLEPLHYCQKCGFYSKAGGANSVNLVRPCLEKTYTGKRNLRALDMGLMPKSYVP